MKLNLSSASWWGAPRKFSTELKDRKISWLELFYDLVYVIAIAKITHHLSQHPTLLSLIDYLYFFIIIFWGWINGSMYYDLHGSEGLRTRLMTLWQMLIVAALIITIDSQEENLIRNITIALMVMQGYITYLWWSIGWYDKSHRKLNKPYTILYLISLGMMFLSLFLKHPYQRIALGCSLILNYLPPFANHFLLKGSTSEIRLSSSMTERLGLLTIILFGEVMTGVVNGVSAMHSLSWNVWLTFSLAVIIVFSLWWIFFTIASDRECRKGFVNSALLELLYIPTLISLGLIGMSFNDLFDHFDLVAGNLISAKSVFGYSLSLFFLGITLMMFLLEFPARYDKLKKTAQKILCLPIIAILILTVFNINFSLPVYLLFMLGIILIVIIMLNYKWYSIYQGEKSIEG